jgi:SPP1 gp7 family putative phage head morphogenesis protein
MPVEVIRKASNPSVYPLLEAALKLEGKIRKAFLEAILAVQSAIVLVKLESAIRSGDVDRVMLLLGLADALRGIGVAAGITTFSESLQSAFFLGAQTALKALPPKIGVSMSFDLLNPESVKFLQKYTMDLIQQLSLQQRQAVQQIITRGFIQGAHPYEQAREIKDAIGLTGRMEQAITNYRAALESGSSTGLQDALNRALRDGRYDPTLLKALRDGGRLTQAQIDAMVDRYRERYLQHRARSIARTESIRASAAGQQELWRQAQQEGRIPRTALRRWIAVGDDRICPICRELHGKKAAINGEFAPGIEYPPAHTTCRCTLALDAQSMKTTAVA